MKLVEVKTTAIEVNPEDWRKLASLMNDFSQICDSSSCPTCPLTKFCDAHDNPADYIAELYKFLGDQREEINK